MSNSLDVSPYKVLKESTGFKEKDYNSLSEEILKKPGKFTVDVNRLRYLCIVIYNQRRCENLKQVPQNVKKVFNVKLKSQLMAPYMKINIASEDCKSQSQFTKQSLL